MQLSSTQSRVDSGVMDTSMAMMLVNIYAQLEGMANTLDGE